MCSTLSSEKKENNEHFTQKEPEWIATRKGDNDFPNSLGTFLKPNICNQAPTGLMEVENFIKEVKTTLVEQVYKYYDTEN